MAVRAHFDEVAELYGITRERVRQIETRGLQKLRQPERSTRSRSSQTNLDRWTALTASRGRVGTQQLIDPLRKCQRITQLRAFGKHGLVVKQPGVLLPAAHRLHLWPVVAAWP